MTITDEDVDVFLEHFGVKGQQWGVRKNRQSTSKDSKEMSKEDKSRRNKKILAAAGVGLVAGGVIFLAVRHKKTSSLPKATISAGQQAARAQMMKNANQKTKMQAVRDAQKYQILAYHKAALLKDPVFARTTPKSLMAKHEKSKAEFDKWLTIRERDLGYKYKGP